MGKRLERRIYTAVENWLRAQEYFPEKTKGMAGVGQADVIGIKAVGTEFYIEPEVVSVEVKRSKGSLGRKSHKLYVTRSSRIFRMRRSLSEIAKPSANEIRVLPEN